MSAADYAPRYLFCRRSVENQHGPNVEYNKVQQPGNAVVDSVFSKVQLTGDFPISQALAAHL